MHQKSRDLPMRLVEHYGENEYSRGKVIQRWCGSGSCVHLSHLLMSFLACLPWFWCQECPFFKHFCPLLLY